MQTQSKKIHQQSQIWLPSHLRMLSLMLFAITLPNSCSGMKPYLHFQCESRAIVSSLNCLNRQSSYILVHPHPSVLAAIPSATQKCRRRMPQTVAKRQMSQGYTWTNRDVGRIACHRHEPHVRSRQIVPQRPLEVGRVEGEEHAQYVPWCDIIQR